MLLIVTEIDFTSVWKIDNDRTKTSTALHHFIVGGFTVHRANICIKRH